MKVFFPILVDLINKPVLTKKQQQACIPILIQGPFEFINDSYEYIFMVLANLSK